MELVQLIYGFWSRMRYLFVLSVAAWWAYALGLKPTHFDEGINGWFVSRVWAEGFYRYNPEHFHGPLYFYLLQLNEIILGYGIESMRLLNVLFGWGSLLLLLAHERWWGRAALWAALIAALSPAFSFYSRYAIHEPVYIFFQILFSYGFWSYWETRSRQSFLIMASSIAALICLKETWFVFLMIWAIAYYCVFWTRRRWHLDNSLPHGRIAKGEVQMQSSEAPSAWFALLKGDTFGTVFTYTSIAVSLFGVFLIYTGWGLDGAGGYKLVKSLLLWTQTGVGKTGHEKAWFYWVELVSRYEIWFFIALGGGVLTLAPVNRVVRVTAVFALGSFIAYSIIPYKTPWLILNFLWPATFLFGWGLERVLEIISESSRRWLRWGLGLFFLMPFIFSGYQSWFLNFVVPASAKEPYIYVQTTAEWGRFWQQLKSYTDKQPVIKNQPVAIGIKQSWPLPYLFGRYAAADLRIDLDQIQRTPEFLKKYSFLIIDLEDEGKFRKVMESNGYLRKQMVLRDGMEPVVIFLRPAEYAGLATQVDGLEPL